MSGSEFQYPDLIWKETCGQMANLVAESGGNMFYRGGMKWVRDGYEMDERRVGKTFKATQ